MEHLNGVSELKLYQSGYSMASHSELNKKSAEKSSTDTNATFVE